MPISSRSMVAAGVVIAIAPLLFAACGSDGYGGSSSPAKRYDTTTAATPTAAAAAAAGGTASTVTVSLMADPNGALMFDTTTLSAKAGTVTVSMKNPSTSGLPHGIAVQGNGVDKDGPTVQPGGTSTVTVVLKPGTYSYYCPVSGHEAGGMKGTLTVR